ncbi:MAG: hypothetical protein WKF73_17470 [Nocardioidaceae bacterium]
MSEEVTMTEQATATQPVSDLSRPPPQVPSATGARPVRVSS